MVEDQKPLFPDMGPMEELEGKAAGEWQVPVKNARRNDPSTSKAAGKRVEKSGKAARQRELVLELVRDNPGKTSLELWQLSGLSDRYVCSRRLPELRERGLIFNGEDRKCTVGGSMSMTWEIKEKQNGRILRTAPR